MNGFTPTQRCILSILADGLPHRPAEIRSCLPDDMALVNTLRTHLSNIRKKLRPKGEDIACVIHCRRMCYQHIVLLAAARS